MSWKMGWIFMAFGLPSVSQGSALVMKDDKSGVMNFITQMNFSGSAVTPQNAYSSALEISRMWNESKASIQYGGKTYRARFLISYTLNKISVFSRFIDNGSCAENFVAIEPLSQSGDRSFYQLFGRNGTFYTSDDLGNSTTAAHEFGHGLGLDHDDYNQIGAEVPGIMFARGTLVKPQFQWNPSALPGNPGGSINPKFRHVRAEDIAKLDLRRVRFTNAYGCLGDGAPLPVALVNVIPSNAKPLRTESGRHEIALSPDVEAERASEAHDH